MDLPVILREKIQPFARRYSREFVSLALCLVVVHVIFGQHGLLAMRRAQNQVEQIRQEIQRLDDENRALQERVKALKSDPRAIERVAREDMGLARRGELIFKIPANPNDPAAPNQPAGSNSQKK